MTEVMVLIMFASFEDPEAEGTHQIAGVLVPLTEVFENVGVERGAELAHLQQKTGHSQRDFPFAYREVVSSRVRDARVADLPGTRMASLPACGSPSCAGEAQARCQTPIRKSCT